MARVFVAIPIEPSVQDEVDSALRERLGATSIPGRAVVAHNRHLTLRFVGQAAADEVNALVSALRAKDFGSSFAARLGGLGAFPRPKAARVLWIGVYDGAEEMATLARLVEAAVVEAGFEPDSRAFKAHLTLSRLDPPNDVSSVVAVVPDLGIDFHVDSIVLYESHLRSGPPVYERLETFPLAAQT